MALREKKAARTKLALLDAALELMKDRPFEQVAVAQIAQEAEISYATFFNYFEKKEDLLLYFVQLWSVQMAHLAQRAGGGLFGIAEVFDRTAELCSQSPEVMEEVLSFLAKEANVARLNIKPLTSMEKRMKFPEIENIEGLGDMGLQSVLPPLIDQAVESGDLPDWTEKQDLMLAISSIFMGTPVALSGARMRGLDQAYRRHLALLWDGLLSRREKDSGR